MINFSLFEVDGGKEKQYCQNLSRLAKLFLDHKTLNWEVSVFFFYVLCECDERGAHVVGYFSKLKTKKSRNNLACILTLPPYQRKGYGKFLIEFSYEMSKIEKKVGTPERPFSDLGLMSYRSYWTHVIISFIGDKKYRNISIQDISESTKICKADIIYMLQYNNLLQNINGKFVIHMDPMTHEFISEKYSNLTSLIDTRKIIWTPSNDE